MGGLIISASIPKGQAEQSSGRQENQQEWDEITKDNQLFALYPIGQDKDAIEAMNVELDERDEELRSLKKRLRILKDVAQQGNKDKERMCVDSKTLDDQNTELRMEVEIKEEESYKLTLRIEDAEPRNKELGALEDLDESVE